MDFSPDGSLIAAGAKGIRIFQVETGMLRETLPAHFDPQPTGLYPGVLSLAFSATGQIASVGWDGTMRLWCSPEAETNQGFKSLATPAGHYPI